MLVSGGACNDGVGDGAKRWSGERGMGSGWCLQLALWDSGRNACGIGRRGWRRLAALTAATFCALSALGFLVPRGFLGKGKEG